MAISIYSRSPSPPCFGAFTPRRCRCSFLLPRRGLGDGHGRRRPAVIMCSGGWSRQGRDFGGELVDEGMAVLRKRIHEVRMAEECRDGAAGPPAHWMEWERLHHGWYTEAVCDAVTMLQGLLMNTRPSVALGMAALLAMSVPTSFVLMMVLCLLRS